MGFCITKCRRFLLSPCDYDLFARVEEPLRGTRYNTKDELIRVIGRSIRNPNKDGRADGVRRLPNIWKRWKNRLEMSVQGTQIQVKHDIPLVWL